MPSPSSPQPRAFRGRPWLSSVALSLGIHATGLLLVTQVPRFALAMDGEAPTTRVATLSRFDPDPAPLEPRDRRLSYPALADADLADEALELPFPTLNESPERIPEWEPPPPEADPFSAPPLRIPARLPTLPPLDDLPSEPAFQETSEAAGAALPQGADAPAASLAQPPPGRPDELAPKPLETPAPVYPMLAERRGIEGAVLLRIRVGVDGRVAQITVERSSGHAVLDDAARRAIGEWRYEPGERDGQPAAMDVLKEVSFRLQA